MRVSSIACVLVGIAALWSAPAAGRTLRIAADRVAIAGVVADDLRIALHAPGATLDGAGLDVSAARLAFDAAGYRYDGVRWRCAWKPLQKGDGWRCDGPLAAKDGQVRLALQLEPGERRLTLRHADARLAVIQRDGAPIETTLAALPARWLQPWLAQTAAATINGGTLTGEVRIRSETDATAIDGDVALDAVGVDAADGLSGIASLSGSTTFDVRLGAARSTATVHGALRGVQVLFGAWYAELPASGVQLDVAASRDAAWRLDTLAYRDAGVLEASYASPSGGVSSTSLTVSDLAAAWPRYAAAWGSANGLDGLQAGGALQLRIDRSADAVQALSVDLRDVSLRDAAERFAIGGATGALQWTAGADAIVGRLDWSSAALFAIPVAAGGVRVDSANGAVRLTEPGRFALLGGAVEIPRLTWQAPRAGAPAAIDLAARIDALDLAQLSARAGWPTFAGTVSGELPDARYRDEVLAFDGGLKIDVFDGQVDVRALRLERPFGVAPTLSADVALSGLDLQPLTQAFGFGEITGRLEGAIAGLRMVDWQAVAFDAELHTSTKASPRRISQRAVDDLSRVGGGGVAAGLQAQALKVFDSFAYARIGLRCRLQNEVCTMGGIAPAGTDGTGYTIVEGSGLPRITVNGFQRRVDWPVLVQRLQTATRDGVRVE